MRFRNFSQLAVAALLFVACVSTASAQVVTASGKVTLKQADGTTVPVKDAAVKFYRTDIKQELNAKTDKGGRYVNAGIPLIGTFTIAVSAPGARPSYITDVRISARPENDFVLDPGDGSALTLAQIKTAMAAGPAAAGTPRAGGALSAEDKKKMAEQQAEIARIEAGNAKIVELNTKLPEILKSGNDAFTAKKYDEALTFYDQGIVADPTQAVFHSNKATVLRARGVDRYNVAVKAKDTPGKEAARADFKMAAEENEKAIAAHRENAAKRQQGTATTPTAGGTPQNEELGYMEQRAETYRIALQTSTQVDTEAAIKAIQEYIAAESDPAKKNKSQAGLGDALFIGGRIDEAVAKFREILASNPGNLDAMFGLGIALAAANPPQIAEARDMLQQFVSKSPENYARKPDAVEMVKYLDETLKSSASNKDEDSKKKPTSGNRRRP
ncbi:MAG: tetratricopeptide repeat protein [Acidobacteriota bacterium]|nr:tetratricopeptide repeat protein [Acidobacteriota bacterium]